jgi:hypothetical protein
MKSPLVFEQTPLFSLFLAFATQSTPEILEHSLMHSSLKISIKRHTATQYAKIIGLLIPHSQKRWCTQSKFMGCI